MTQSRNSLPERPLDRARQFCAECGLALPILLAPMAAACPVSLSVAVAKAGGMGAMGAVMSSASGVRKWVEDFRAAGGGVLQLNTWVPDPPAARDPAAEERIRSFLATWGPTVPASAAKAIQQEFDAQCEAFLDLRPTAVSSIMGVFPDPFVRRLKDSGIRWFATATTLSEAMGARDAGADAIIAQGYEAGGHRGSFDPSAERPGAGL